MFVCIQYIGQPLREEVSNDKAWQCVPANKAQVHFCIGNNPSSQRQTTTTTTGAGHPACIVLPCVVWEKASNFCATKPSTSASLACSAASIIHLPY